MTSGDAVDLTVGVLTGLGASTVFILALFLGFCIILGFPKLRATTGRGSMVVKSLEETVGQEAFVRYMRPDAPRGPVDVLKTPELLERAAKSSTIGR
jgi:hypothetical protein